MPFICTPWAEAASRPPIAFSATSRERMPEWMSRPLVRLDVFVPHHSFIVSLGCLFCEGFLSFTTNAVVDLHPCRGGPGGNCHCWLSSWIRDHCAVRPLRNGRPTSTTSCSNCRSATRAEQLHVRHADVSTSTATLHLSLHITLFTHNYNYFIFFLALGK